MIDPIDLDGDGIIDGGAEAMDLNGDGITDAVYMGLDTNGDGMVDTESIDMDADGDGVPDLSMSAIDVDHDGSVDVLQADMDLNADGLIDASSISVDLDGDGSMDLEATAVDLDGDGIADILECTDQAAGIWDEAAEAPGNLTPDDSLADFDGTYDDLSFPGYAELYDVHGSPSEDMALWDPQDDPMSCAVATTNMLFRSVGINDVGETQIAEVFEKAGIYDPSGGTNPDLIDDQINIMAREMGLEVHAEEFSGFTPDSLAEMLDSGVRPLVGVDSSELYDPITRTLNEVGLIPDAGHAVQVTGIVHGDDGDFVVINDPGFPGGAGQQIPMEQFMDAAEDYGFKGVAVMEGSPGGTDSAFPWVHMASLAGITAATAAATKRKR